MTPAWVAALKSEGAPVEWRDTKQRGLVLRVETSGYRSWVARYVFKGRDRRFKIGSFPEKSLAEARAECKGIIGRTQGRDGTDPQVERERQAIGDTVRTAVASWLDDQKLGPAARWKGGLEGGSSLLEERREGESRAPLSGSGRCFVPHVRRFVSELGTKRLAELSSGDLERFVSSAEAAATRNRRLTALRGFLRWARRKELIAADPSAGLEKVREEVRTRTLRDEELAALIQGFDATRYGRAVRLLALTGLRRDEVLGARWSWVESAADRAAGGVLTIPPEAEKTGKQRGEPRRVALSPAAVDLLGEQRAALFAEGVRSEWIFATSAGERPHGDALKPILYRLRGRRSTGQAPATGKRAKQRTATLPADVTIHDVRRTVADALLNRIGAAPWVVDHVVLGHARPKLLRTYMPNLPLDEARAALSRWAEELQRITTPAARSSAAP